MKRFPLGFCAAVLLIVGCQASAHKAPLGEAALASASAHPELEADAICASSATCCTALGVNMDLTRCRDHFLGTGGLHGENLDVTPALLAGGNITYDAAAASACLAGLEALGCADLTSAAHLPTVAACSAVYSGTLVTGEACQANVECATGYHCEAGACAPLKATGDACTDPGECGYRAYGATCDGVCGGTRGDGEACARGPECASGLCSGTCTSSLPTSFDAAFCAGLEAAPPACGFGMPTLCAAGEACVVDGDCTRGNACNAGVCAEVLPETLFPRCAGCEEIIDYDFTDTRFAWRESGATPDDVQACDLPFGTGTCNRPMPSVAPGTHVSIIDDRLYYATKTDLPNFRSDVFIRSVNIDTGLDPRIDAEHNIVGGFPPSLRGLFGGAADQIVDIQYAGQVAPHSTRTITFSAPAGIVGRTPRGTRGRHQNVDAGIHYQWMGANPPALIVTGATVPNMIAGSSVINGLTEMATSPRSDGSGPLAHPAVALVRNGRVYVCPTAANCGAWLDVAPGTTVNFDETHLYIGSTSDLGRCSLEEIGTLGTCTLTPIVTGEAVNQLYLTPTHAVYNSPALGVRRVQRDRW